MKSILECWEAMRGTHTDVCCLDVQSCCLSVSISTIAQEAAQQVQDVVHRGSCTTGARCEPQWSLEFVTIFYVFFFFLMIRRPPRSTQSSSSAASDMYKGQEKPFLFVFRGPE